MAKKARFFIFITRGKQQEERFPPTTFLSYFGNETYSHVKKKAHTILVITLHLLISQWSEWAEN